MFEGSRSPNASPLSKQESGHLSLMYKRANTELSVKGEGCVWIDPKSLCLGNWNVKCLSLWLEKCPEQMNPSTSRLNNESLQQNLLIIPGIQ